MLVCLYSRVSSAEQAQHGVSLEEQQKSLREWAEANGHTVVGEFCDAGISARKSASKRPALQLLLDYVRAGKVECIAFTKLDRWTRNIGQYYKVQEVLDEHKVAWTAIQEDYETITVNGRFKVNIMLSVAEQEADRDGERIRAAFALKKAKSEACSGHTAIGIKIVDKHYVADEKADAIRACFDGYLRHQSWKSARRVLEEAGGGHITVNGIKMLLRNENYVKTGIISADQFRQVQELAKSRSIRRNSTGNVYLFSGLVKCEVCGKSVCPRTRKNGYVRYMCNGHAYDQTCPNNATIREIDLEDRLKKELLLDLENVTVLAKKKKVAPKVHVDALNRKKEKLLDLYLNDLIDKEKYEKEFKEIQNQLNASAEPLPAISIDEIKSGLSLYDGLSVEGKAEFWRRIIKKITLTKEGDFYYALRT